MAKKTQRRATPEELQAENRHLRRHGVATSITKVVTSIIQWGVIAFIAYEIKETAVAWAGKTTRADINVSGTASASFEMAVDRMCGTLRDVQEASLFVTILAMLLAVSAVVYGRRQAQLRRSVIQRLSPFEQAYEKGIDPRRTSSKIQTTGETRPEDK